MSQALFDISIEKVHFYEKNPRSHHDPEAYAALKNSIREIGIKHPVKVIQRPNSEKYILSAGGNSRLKILQELFRETGDKKYSTIPALIEDFETETQLLIQHVVENEQRQEMSFWDKVNAYHALKIELEKLHNKTFSLRELGSIFEKEGVSVNHRLLGEVVFLKKIFGKCSAYADTLQQLSRQKYSDIRSKLNPILETALKRGYAEEEVLGKYAMALSDTFLCLVSREGTDLMSVVDAALTSLMNQLKIDADEVVSVDKAPAKKDKSPAVNQNQALPKAKVDNESTPIEVPFETQKSVVTHAIPETEAHHAGIPFAANLVAENTANTVNNTYSEPLNQVALDPFEAAKTLADLVGLSNALQKNDKMLFGFFIEVPYQLEHEMDFDMNGIFWVLANLTVQYSDLTVNQNPAYLSLPKESLWRKFMINEDAEVIDNVKFIIGEETDSSYFIQNVLTDPQHRLLNPMLNLFSVVRKTKEGADHV